MYGPIADATLSALYQRDTSETWLQVYLTYESQLSPEDLRAAQAECVKMRIYLWYVVENSVVRGIMFTPTMN